MVIRGLLKGLVRLLLIRGLGFKMVQGQGVPPVWCSGRRDIYGLRGGSTAHCFSLAVGCEASLSKEAYGPDTAMGPGHKTRLLYAPKRLQNRQSRT